MVSSIFYKRISLRFRTHFVFGVSESTTKYVDIIRMISSIPSLRLQLSDDGIRGTVDVMQALQSRLVQVHVDQLPANKVIVIQLTVSCGAKQFDV
jgi:hypothetical protein